MENASVRRSLWPSGSILPGKEIGEQFAGVGQLPGLRLIADFDDRFREQILAFGLRRGRRMEEIQEHVSERRKLRQQQFRGVGRSLPRSFQGKLAQPYRERLAALLGSRFDLPQLLRSDPCRDGFGAEAGLLLGAFWSARSRRSDR